MSITDNQPPQTKSQHQFDYVLLSPLGGQTAHIQFRGPFQGQQVLWDTHLVTLEEIHRQNIAAGNYPDDDTISLSQFIEINEKDAGEFTLRVGIDVPAIDVPTVLKTIIMIHNYKRLRHGRQEYGPMRKFS